MRRIQSLLSVALLLSVAVPAVANRLLYSNGGIRGDTNAYNIGGGEVTDSFALYSPAAVETMSLGVWVPRGDTPSTLTFGISTTQFGGGGGTGTLSNVFQFTNSFGLDVYLSTLTFSRPVDLAAGAYWVTLTNGFATNGDPLLWDANFGDSDAFELDFGPIPSESFSLFGTVTTPEPGTLIMLGTGLLTGIGVVGRKLSS